LRPDQIGLLHARTGKGGLPFEPLEKLELRQHLVAEEIKLIAQECACLRVLPENAVEPLHVRKLLAILSVHRQRQVRASIEPLMDFPMAPVAQSYAIARLKSCFRQKRLSANVVGRQTTP
jgi:hypothetical protein